MDNEPKKDEGGGGAPDWMVTYGDLVTLLMCFFVLLFAFSEIDAQKFEAVMQSFQGSAGILSGGTSLSESPLVFQGMPENDTTKRSKDIKEEAQAKEELQKLKEVIEAKLQEEAIDIKIKAEVVNRGLIIRFPDNALFDSGKAVLKDKAIQTLDIIGKILSDPEFIDKVIRIEGHTDNVPMRTKQYPSNWELSTARAVNVLKFFINEAQLDPDRLGASGYSKYHPIATNDTVEGRSENRRVDIVVLNSFFLNSQNETEEGEE